MFSRFKRRIGTGNAVYRPNGREKFFKKVKSFDPTNIVSTVNTQTEEVFVEEIIKNSFSDFNISPELKQNIIAKGYKTPTPIQDQAIIPILEGQDLIGIANTGTGKTAAFLIPLINKVINDRNQKVLIVAPTRELAVQIDDEFKGFTRNLRIYSTLLIGGANIRRQIYDLQRNPSFVIGTPGRILDILRQRQLNLQKFQSVVLDEADRMVDIGFIKDIKYIVSLLPNDRQSLFFSATIEGGVRDILNSFVQNPIIVSVKKKETAVNIAQEVIRVENQIQKIEKLHELLIQKEFDKVLVFGRTKHGVQRLSNELNERGFKSDAIHGNKRQSQRQNTLDRFKRGEIQILIATDVASRGLDIPNVSHVINYDLPESRETYVHRIGRTGRADKKGIAISFTN